MPRAKAAAQEPEKGDILRMGHLALRQGTVDTEELEG